MIFGVMFADQLVRPIKAFLEKVKRSFICVMKDNKHSHFHVLQFCIRNL